MEESKPEAIVPEVMPEEEEPQVIETSLVPTNTEGAQRNLPKLSDDDIKKHVDEINDMVGESLYETYIKVGKYVLKEFFINDIQVAMSKNPYKTASYRKLQEHPDLKIHYNMLNNMVRVAAQEDLLTKALGKKDTKLLSYSHHVELLKFDDETKITIARKCIDDKLSIRGMRKQVKGTREGHHSSNILPFNSMLTNILHNYSGGSATIDKLKKLSLKTIQQMQLNVESFLSQVDEAKYSILLTHAELIAIYAEKKKEKDKPKEKMKRGRPKGKTNNKT